LGVIFRGGHGFDGKEGGKHWARHRLWGAHEGAEQGKEVGFGEVRAEEPEQSGVQTGLELPEEFGEEPALDGLEELRVGEAFKLSRIHAEVLFGRAAYAPGWDGQSSFGVSAGAGFSCN
jgi:hypothetical protein